jgi:AcrR family transcriptional regulator
LKSIPVKKKRSYDASARLEQARRTREHVLDVARRAFLAHGYGPTTLAAVAREAGVSVETIHKVFGGKSGLVKAICERALAGSGPRPARDRSDAISAAEPDAREIARSWGRLSAEVSPLVSPVLLLVRDAAATDPELAALLREIDRARLERMTRNARVLRDRGFLRRGMSVDRAGRILWALASPELYDLFVVRGAWTAAELGAFVADSIIAALL